MKYTRSIRNLLLLLGLLLCLHAAALAAPSPWADAEVKEAISEGLVPTALQRRYQDPITRAEFCELIAQVVPATTGTAFPDCGTAAVRTCAAYGLVAGYPDGNFYPNDLLTREQAASILRRLAAFQGSDTDSATLLRVFTDSVDISTYAATSVQWAYENGIMFGNTDGSFEPGGDYTREQSIMTLLRLQKGGTPAAAPRPLRTLTAADYCATVTEAKTDALSRRTYSFTDGTEAVMGRLNGVHGLKTLYSAWIPGSAILRTPGKNGWNVQPLRAGTYAASCCYVDSDAASFWFIMPMQYRLQANATLEYLPGCNGYLDVQAAEGGFYLRLQVQALGQGIVTDYTAVSAPRALFDWYTNRNAARYMLPHTLDGDSRWCYDGYYYPSPDNYVPAGPNFYHRNVACYFGNSMADAIGYYYGCDIISLVIADTMVQLQNAAGYMPTEQVSGWLIGDYGIGKGFYDTRFNSDLMEILFRVATRLQTSDFDRVMNRYMDFCLGHAEEHHRTTASGGWLVDDYSLPGTVTATHTSLNHQLSEMSVLYKLSDVLGRQELADLADKMLLGLTDLGRRWVKDDHNLHYSSRADGTLGGNDYPYLTYNDLYKMQALLEDRTGRRSPVLQMLMDEKHIWMTANGVTGYLGE